MLCAPPEDELYDETDERTLTKNFHAGIRTPGCANHFITEASANAHEYHSKLAIWNHWESRVVSKMCTFSIFDTIKTIYSQCILLILNRNDEFVNLLQDFSNIRR